MTKKHCQHISESQWLVRRLDVTRKLNRPEKSTLYSLFLAYLQVKGVVNG